MADAPPPQAIKTVPKPRDQHLRDMADCIRFLSMDAVQQAKSGHPGAPMGMADIATVLFRDFMQFDAADPHWFDRDRFVLSNGHASMLLYSLLYLTGYQDMTLDQLKRFRQIDSKTLPVTPSTNMPTASRRRRVRSAKASPTRWVLRLPSAL